MTPGSRIRVFLVDDHPLVASGVAAELGAAFDVVGTAEDVATAVAGIVAARPDVVLLDVHLPGGGGAQVISGVRAAGVAAAFLALSVSDAAEDVIGVIRAGARGYVTKSISPDELAAALQRVHGGDAVFSPRLAGFVLDAFAAAPVAGAPDRPPPGEDDPLADIDQLTPREREVLRLIARGLAYKQVARRLEISVKTVETHVSNVLRKLQLTSRYELARWANDRRLL